MLESFPPQQGSEFPGNMQSFSQAVDGRSGQNRVGLFIGESVRAPNHTAREARAFHLSMLIELNKHWMSEPIDSGVETANTVA